MFYDSAQRMRTQPVPADPSEAARWQHTALRRRILSGQWGDDLERWLIAHLGPVRREVMGPQDLSSNLLRTIAYQLAALYDEPPKVTHPSGDVPGLLGAAEDGTPGLVDEAGLWPLMQRFQQLVLGANEYVMHVAAVEDNTGAVRLHFRPVPPDYLVIESTPQCPSRPVRLRELVLREDPDAPDTYVWTWDEYDATPDAPRFRVLRPTKERARGRVQMLDITAQVFAGPTFDGDDYRWRYATGAPFVPYVLYHRAAHGQLWDPYDGRELVDGTLTAAVLWSFWVHCVRDAGWPQKWSLDAVIAGAFTDTRGAGGSTAAPRQMVPTDPSSVVNFLSRPDTTGTQPQIGQWGPGCDPEALQRAIAKYEERLAQFAGINPSDLSRTSGDPRSGYALAVSSEGKRIAQKRFRPQFEASDRELLGMSAALVNRASSTDYPESGYQIAYAGLDEAPVAAVAADGTPAVAGDAAIAKVADTALNGAQVVAAQGIVADVAAGKLPRDAGVAMIAEFFQLDPVAADRVFGSVGKTFKPAVDPSTAQPPMESP